MKLLVSAYACIPNRGSEPGNGWNWTLENAKLGHAVWCFTTPEGKQAITDELKKYPELKITVVYVDVPPLVNYLYRFQPFLYLHYLMWQAKAGRKAREIDREVDFDLVLHASMTSFQLGSGMWRVKKPLIFGPVGGGSFPPKAFKKYFFGKWHIEVIRKWTSDLLLLFNKSIRSVAKNGALIVVANHDTYKMAKQLGATRIKMFLDVGLPESFFPEVIPVRDDRKVLKILWVGRIFPRKGLPLVLEALSKVRKDLPYHLTIIGDGTHGHLMPELLKKYDLEAVTDWKGQVAWEVVKQAYVENHIFIFCSLRDTFGAQYLEAMAYGLPIISLKHQGAGDHIPDDAGIKVAVTYPDDTVKNIALAIEYMYDHPEECTAFGLRGSEFAKNQTWESRALRLAELYRDVVPEKVG